MLHFSKVRHDIEGSYVSHFRLLTVGQPRDARLKGLVDEYLTRLRRDVPVDWAVVPEEPFRRGTESRAVLKEQEHILSRISRDEFAILLDVNGQSVSSHEISQRFQSWRDQSRRVVWVVGGSLGVGDEVKRRADWQWSLSPLTFPHGLAHVIVAEQLYRAWTIIQGHPYHKA